MALDHQMDISLSAARKMADAALAASDALNKALLEVKQTESEAVFIAYREAVSEALMVLLTDVLNPVFAKYPELKPGGFQ